MSLIETFKMKQNDTGPALAVTLKDINQYGVESLPNLTGATVVFHMRPRGSAVAKIDSGAVTITDAEAAEVEYPWQAGDTDTSGDFIAEFEVTFLSGAVVTYPRDGYVPIRIGDEIG